MEGLAESSEKNSCCIDNTSIIRKEMEPRLHKWHAINTILRNINNMPDSPPAQSV